MPEPEHTQTHLLPQMWSPEWLDRPQIIHDVISLQEDHIRES